MISAFILSLVISITAQLSGRWSCDIFIETRAQDPDTLFLTWSNVAQVLNRLFLCANTDMYSLKRLFEDRWYEEIECVRWNISGTRNEEHILDNEISKFARNAHYGA